MTEFTYRMSSQKDKTARICMSIQTKTEDEFVDVVNSINAQDGMHATDLTDNELAKSHLRHLAGGRAEDVRQTLALYRISAPTVLVLMSHLNLCCMSTTRSRTSASSG